MRLFPRRFSIPDRSTHLLHDAQFHAERGRLRRWREWELATASRPCAKTIERRWGLVRPARRGRRRPAGAGRRVV